MLGSCLSTSLCLLLAACNFDPSVDWAGNETVAQDDGAPSDGRARLDASPDARAAACLTNGSYVVRAGSTHRYYFQNSGLVYDEAQAACATDGATLVIINDQLENDYVAALSGDPWIGFNDYDEEGKFAWVGGATLGGTAAYENWRGGEPSDSGNKEDCAILDGEQWNDGECSDQREFVCECDPALVVPPPPPCMTSANYSEIHQGRRYRVGEDDVNHAQAKASCASEGGHLVVITDDEESEYVDDMTSDDCWIGYDDLKSEGDFRWVTGSASSYTRWGGGQPNNSGDEDCVEAETSRDWNDIDCSQALPFVCECDPNR